MSACPCESGKPFGECHGDKAPLEGWKQIAAALGVSEDTAQRYAMRSYMPLVVFYDHADRAWCPASHVRDFKSQHHLPAWAHHALKSRELLPHQVARKTKRAKPTRRDRAA